MQDDATIDDDELMDVIIHVHVRVCVCTQTYHTYIYIYIHTYTYLYIYTYTYTYIYIHHIYIDEEMIRYLNGPMFDWHHGLSYRLLSFANRDSWI